jgi:hypothetical protein
VLLVVFSAVLVAVSLGKPRPEPLEGIFLGPWVSTVLCLTVVVLTPGFVLFRLIRGEASWPHAVAFSFGLGGAWTMMWGAAMLLSGSGVETFVRAIAVLNPALVVGYLLIGVRRGPLPLTAVSRPKATDPWLLGGALAMVTLLVAIPTSWKGLTVGGDEWTVMYQLRFLLETTHIQNPFATTLPGKFDVWNLTLALLIRLSRVNLLEAYRLYLPAAFIVMVSVALFLLADTLFEDPNVGLLAVLIQGLYCLSDLQPRGEGAGMALFVRLLEDKYAACLLFLPGRLCPLPAEPDDPGPALL